MEQPIPSSVTYMLLRVEPVILGEDLNKRNLLHINNVNLNRIIHRT